MLTPVYSYFANDFYCFPELHKRLFYALVYFKSSMPDSKLSSGWKYGSPTEGIISSSPQNLVVFSGVGITHWPGSRVLEETAPVLAFIPGILPVPGWIRGLSCP